MEKAACEGYAELVRLGDCDFVEAGSRLLHVLTGISTARNVCFFLMMKFSYRLMSLKSRSASGEGCHFCWMGRQEQ